MRLCLVCAILIYKYADFLRLKFKDLKSTGSSLPFAEKVRYPAKCPEKNFYEKSASPDCKLDMPGGIFTLNPKIF